MDPGLELKLPAFEPHAQLGRISRKTVQDQVYQSLRRAIMQGDVKPGENLTIPALAQAFGISHMPVRQALNRLAAEQALTILSGRSVGVPPLSRSRLVDLTRVRTEVEGLAAAWAAEQIASDRISELAELVADMWSYVEGENAREFLTRNQQFHFAVYKAADSGTLLPIIESLWLQIGPYLSLLHRSGNYSDANRHHESLLQALRDRDAVRAREAVTNDIRAAAAVLEELVPDA